MKRAFLVLFVSIKGRNCLLMPQRNIYLHPHGKYQFATIARNAMQYVIPNCKPEPWQAPKQAILDEARNSLGLDIEESALATVADLDDAIVWSCALPENLALETIRYNLDIKNFPSAQYRDIAAFSPEDVFSHLGNQSSFHHLEWVKQQVEQAQGAGFSNDFIHERINTSHEFFTWIIARCITSTPPSLKSIDEKSGIIS